jgi:dolichyl-phosphate-mannose-protein mannosyltransferase
VPPVVQPLANQQVLKDDDNKNNGAVTAQPEQPNVIGREERVEYRDQEGNLLNEEQVASLKKDGKASFQTKYETQTRVIDADGQEVLRRVEHAPPHPDVDGQDPQTGGKGKGDESAVGNKPASAAGQDRSVRNEDQPGKPKPASEGNEATK